MNATFKTLVVIAAIGAINWGLVGFFNYNLVDAIFGAPARMETTGLARVVYAIVGLAGLAALFFLPRAQADVPRAAHGAARPSPA